MLLTPVTACPSPAGTQLPARAAGSWVPPTWQERSLEKVEDPESSPSTGQRGPEAWWGSQWPRCGCLEAQTPALQTQASCTHNLITSHES